MIDTALLTRYHDDATSTGPPVAGASARTGAVTGGTPFVEYTYDLTASGGVFTKGARPDTVVYPSGRVVEYAYAAADDPLGRVTSVGTDDDLTSYAYLGLGTFVAMLYSSEGDTVAKLIYTGGGSGDAKYPGLDRFNRVVDHRWIDGEAADLDRFQYGYDANSNRIWRRNVTAAALDKPFDELYAYDRVNRLVDFQRGTLNGGRTAIVGTPAKQQDWTLDATGNWSHFTSADEGALETDQTRLHNGANEITELSSWYPPSYDHAGNMTRLPKLAAPSEGFAATYDAWNRLVSLSEVTCGCPGDLVAQYQYDAQTWRTLALTYEDGELDETRHYFYSAQWQILEERLGALTTPEREHVWGLRYIDDLSRRYRDTDGDGDEDETLWALQDANWNVTSVIDRYGDVAERFAYEPYGSTAVFSVAFGPIPDSYQWRILLCSYQCDDLALLHVRWRSYSVILGRWTTVDPAIYAGSANTYEYVNSSPVDLDDPLGLGPVSYTESYKALSAQNHYVRLSESRIVMLSTGVFTNVLHFRSTRLKKAIEGTTRAVWAIAIPFECTCDSGKPRLQFDFNTYRNFKAEASPVFGKSITFGDVTALGAPIGVGASVSGSYNVDVGLVDVSIIGDTPCANVTGRVHAGWSYRWQFGASIGLKPFGVNIPLAKGKEYMAEITTEPFSVECCIEAGKPKLSVTGPTLLQQDARGSVEVKAS